MSVAFGDEIAESFVARVTMRHAEAKSYRQALHAIHDELFRHFEFYQNADGASIVALLDDVTWKLMAAHVSDVLDAVEASAMLGSTNEAVFSAIRAVRHALRTA